MQRHRTKLVCAGLLAVALGALGASSAQAHLTGEFTRFSNCPYKDPTAIKCIYSVTEGGEVVLGSKKVPIVNPVVLQGAYGEPVEEKEGADFYPFIAATNGVTLSKAAQPVPGGLAGLVNCKEIKEPILRGLCELALENGVTGASSTLELAKPASAIRISENNLAGEIGTALELPVKIHLENPFLGSNCYVGANSPIIWKLSSASPGFGGEGEFLEGFKIVKLKGNVLVDKTWSAPGVTGCGGPLVELLLNPVVNASAGLPATAGKNSAVLKNTIYESAAVTVNKNDIENP
jgi:hypothetical protein